VIPQSQIRFSGFLKSVILRLEINTEKFTGLTEHLITNNHCRIGRTGIISSLICYTLHSKLCDDEAVSLLLNGQDG
jgi:hypothetical protein